MIEKQEYNMPYTEHTVYEQIKGLIEQLNAYIEQYHGGSVELDRIEEDTVYVKLGGACEDCPLSRQACRVGLPALYASSSRHQSRKD